MSQAEAAELEFVLTGPDPAAALLPGIRIDEAVLPAGTTLDVHEDLLTESDGLAVVPVTVSGPEAGDWLLLLAREGAEWRVYGTRRP